MEPLFKKYPKTPRLYREVVITEKLDGTNGTIIIKPLVFVSAEYSLRDEPMPKPLAEFSPDHDRLGVYAGSRNRLLTLENDNYGFADWVYKNAIKLFHTLGEGRFSGEWYGLGIQKNPYGLDHKRFALFRTDLMQAVDESGIKQLETVPVLYEGPYEDGVIDKQLYLLRTFGSHASEFGAPFYKGEGVCMYHKDSGQVFKHTHDNEPKGSK